MTTPHHQTDMKITSEADQLWGPSSTLSTDTMAPGGFEDSFSPDPSSYTQGEEQSPTEGTYIPLQDSSQYLAGLEQKLARLQGRTASSRKSESRRLLEALAGSRCAHTSLMMRDDSARCEEHTAPIDSTTTAHSSTTVDPQGALGAMLRRVAPDRVALAPEELCHLLQADILAQAHQVEEEEETHQETQPPSSQTMKLTKDEHDPKDPRLGRDCDGGQKDHPEARVTCAETLECKEQSSDEGEK